MKKAPDQQRKLRDLLGRLCTDWGFCLPPAEVERIAKNETLSSEAFASAVLLAEGMSAEYELEWFRKIRRRFTDEFASSNSSAVFVPNSKEDHS